MTRMSDNDWVARTLARRRPRGLLTLAAGFLVGVLVTALVAPDGSRVSTDASVTGVGGRSAVSSGASGAGGGSGTGGDAGAGPAATGADGGAAGGGAGVTGAASGGDGGAAAPGAAPGAGGAGTPAASGGATAPGVKANAIRIGIGLPDIGAIAALGPGYDQGDPHKHVDAILAQLREEKKLPVNGRDIVPVYRTYNILSQDEQRATCEGFGKDDGVFAVVAVHDFGVGAECVAREFKTPLITTDGQSSAVYKRSWPNLFTLQMSFDRMLNNFAEWADESGYLKGKRIGVYYPSDPEAAQAIEQSLLRSLSKKGANVVAKVQTDQYTTGGPTDSVAMQQFRTARVDVAILLVSAVAKTNFFNQAQSQGYKPLYLENDLGFSTTNTATSTYPASYFDGTPAFTGMRFGEGVSGIPETQQALWCKQAIKKHAGITLDRDKREAEYIAANQACDEINAMLGALAQAGPNLTRAGYVAGLESIRNRPQGIHSDVTFNQGRHDGGSTWRTLKWAASCKCWHAQGAFRPLWIQ